MQAHVTIASSCAHCISSWKTIFEFSCVTHLFYHALRLSYNLIYYNTIYILENFLIVKLVL